MSRRTKDERKEDYLDIGAVLVAESALAGESEASLALSHVKLAEVADRAGVTKGALYHIWPSQEAYWSDLLVHLLENNQLFAPDLATAFEQFEPDEPTAMLRQYGDLLFDSLCSSPAFFARISLFAYLDDAEVRDALDAEFRGAVDRIGPMLEEGVNRVGRRFTNEHARSDLFVSIGALLEGFCLEYRINPARTPDLDVASGERRTLFSAAAEALLLAYTEPIEGWAPPAASTDAAHDAGTLV